MADLKISELAALASANLAAGDFLPVADVSASETKKITVTDFTGKAITLIADATIPGAKILFGTNQVPGTALVDSGVTSAKLASDSVTSAKLADQSTVDLVTTLPASGAFVGQLALDTDNLKVYCWDGTIWQSIKAAGSINTVTGSSTGVVNISVTTSGDTVTIATTLDSTTAAGQFLGGPASNGGAVSYRNLVGTDLPAATASAKGGVIVNGEGLRMDGDRIEVNNDVTANTTDYYLVRYTSKGLVTAGRDITGADLPPATSTVLGGVKPGSGLSVAVDGTLNHSSSVTAGTATKLTFNAQGHITGTSTLLDTDIPNLPASKVTTGTFSADRFGTNTISGIKLANSSTVKFGGAGSTAGVVTFPTPEFQGQYFFDNLNGDLYLYDGSAWRPITITAGELIYGGTYNAATNTVKSVTAAGAAAGLTVSAALPAASSNNIRYYVVVSDSGTGVSPAPTTALAPPDMLVSSGATWDLIDVSNAIAGQIASNISFTPYGNLAANNVQTALQELDDEKLANAGGTVTGILEIGATGSLTWEGSAADAFETLLTVVNPTADRTITLPDATGTVVLSGAIVNADISASAAITDTKLATITTAGKVSNSATTAASANTASAIVARDASGNFTAGTITATTFSGSGASLTSLPAGQLSGTVPSSVLGNSSLNVGTTSIALNRASANQALTGISSVALPGATSGTITVQPAAVAGATTITVPATTGTLITTGDTGTVTNTMVASGIAGSKITPNFGSQTIETTGVFSHAQGTAALPSVTFTGNVVTGIFSPGANQVAISTAATERCRVDGAGRLLLGTNTSITSLVQAGLQVQGTGASAYISSGRWSNDASRSELIFNKSRGTAVGTRAIVLANDSLGAVSFTGDDGVAFQSAALILASVDGTPGANEMPGRLVFSTTPSGSATTVERMRIGSTGAVAIGSTITAGGGSGCSIRFANPLTGSTSPVSILGTPQVQADATGDSVVFSSAPSTTDLSALNRVSHYQASSITLGSGTFLTSQIGFHATSNITAATNNYGFFSNIPAATGRWNFYAAGTADSYFASNNFIFANGGTEKARVDSAGRLLVGTSTALGVSSANPSDLEVETTGIPLSAVRNSADATGAVIALGKSRGATAGSLTAVVDGDILGEFRFAGADGTTRSSYGGAIQCRVDGTPGTGDMPGRLVLGTTAEGAASPTEHWRISSDGTFIYNQPAPAAVNTTATLTVANLTAKIITSTTAAAVTMTLPTGTDMDAGFSGLYNNMAFEWSVINTGATNAVTVQGGTGHTVVGSGTVAASNSGRFLSRRTAATTWVTYRLSS